MTSKMDNDEQAIRNLIATWLRASAAGDVDQVLSLMAEDVVFLVPGQPPMRGRNTFAAGFKAALQHMGMVGTSSIQEIEVAGDWAYCWTRLTVLILPRMGGPPMRKSGYTLSILRKQPDGRWLLTRDANMLAPEASAS